MSKVTDKNDSEAMKLAKEKQRAKLNTMYMHLLLNQIALMTPYTQRTNMLFRLPQFNGDPAQVAKFGATLSAFNAGSVILLQSIAGKASDAFGRKMFLAMGPVVNIMLKTLVFMSPTISNIVLERIVGASLSTVSGTMISVAAISDLFPGDSQGFAEALSYIGALVGFGILAGPVLGRFAERIFGQGLKSAFLLSAIVSALQLGNVMKLNETLKEDERKSFKLSDCNPFSFLRLFREDFQLIKLSFLSGMFHNCSEGKNLADLHQSYGKKDVGLQDDIRWVMTSFVGLWVFISGFVSRRLMKVLGGRSFTTMASAFRVVGMTWYANIPWRVKQLWTMNVGSFLGSFGWQSGKYPQAVTINYAVKNCGWGRGEITAAINQLREIMAIVGPLIYARIYAAASGSWPGAHYQFVGLLCFLTEVFGRYTIKK